MSDESKRDTKYYEEQLTAWRAKRSVIEEKILTLQRELDVAEAEVKLCKVWLDFLEFQFFFGDDQDD